MKNQGTTEALLKAAFEKDWQAAARILETDCEINLSDEDGRTALMFAAIDCQEDFVGLLLPRGAEVNIQDIEGYTALHFAAQAQHLGIVKKLVESGNADVDIKDAYGNSALWRAVFSAEDDGAVIRFLIQRGADINLSNDHGVSPKVLAETIANFDVKKFLER